MIDFSKIFKIEWNYQLQQILEIFCDENSHYRIGLDKINDPTWYRYGQLVKEMIEVHVSNIIRQWIVGDGSINDIQTSQVENMNCIARSCKNLVRKQKALQKSVHCGFATGTHEYEISIAG